MDLGKKTINNYQDLYFQLSDKIMTDVFIIHTFAQQNSELQMRPELTVFYLTRQQISHFGKGIRDGCNWCHHNTPNSPPQQKPLTHSRKIAVGNI